MTGETAAATFCAAIVDEWVRAGVSDAVVTPGSRSTPLTLALAARTVPRLHVHLDERSAGFCALGLGLSSGRPAVAVTTSGTAAAELHPAVVEAHHARVPLIVVTADRPPELQDVGASQTIDQTRLFGPAVRWFAEPGAPEWDAAGSWRSLGARSVAEATKSPPGPVHLNLAFRDPLVGVPGAIPEGRRGGRPWHEVVGGTRRASRREVDAVRDALEGRAGVIVAGRGAPAASDVCGLAARLGWPVLADQQSGCRVPGSVGRFDPLLRHAPFAETHRPEVVLQLGAPPASKILAEWIAGSGAHHVVVDRHDAWLDAGRLADVVAVVDPDDLLQRLEEVLTAGVDAAWASSWAAAERAAGSAVSEVLAAHEQPSEPGIAQATVAALPDGSSLVVASSMPIRDVEWYAEPREGVRVLANRGANGIDGVISPALGVALDSGPTAALVGDVAFLHDSGALVGLADRDIDLVVVVVNNDGGGIFSFLPQATALEPAVFERLFGTPHGTDIGAVAAAFGVEVNSVERQVGVAPAVASAAGAGVRLVVAETDRQANVAVHEDLAAAVAARLDAEGISEGAVRRVG